MSIDPKIHYSLDVYLWNTVYFTGEPGHISLAINKLDANGHLSSKRHFGFWPNREFTPSDIPFYLPAIEKISLKTEVFFSADEPAFTPDKHYEFPINKEQYANLENEIEKQSNNIKSGKTRYTWLVAINNIFYKIAYSFSDFQINLENCSTIATKILQAGGILVKNTNVFWGISPSSLGHQLDALISEKKIAGSCSSAVVAQLCS